MTKRKDLKEFYWSGVYDKHGEKICVGDRVKLFWENEYRYVHVEGIVRFIPPCFTTEIVYWNCYWKQTNETDYGYELTNLLRYHPSELEIIKKGEKKEEL